MRHESTDFSVTTYNILADSYISTKRYPDCDAASLDPRLRLDRLLQLIDELDSDVLCLQEVERSVFEALDVRLSESHVGSLSLKTGRPEGCALFVAQHLGVDSSETVRFRSFTGSGNQLALVARLRIGTRRFGIASTHLQWMPPSTPIAEHTGAHQLAELIEQTSGDFSIPWILAGDFNAEVESPVLETARRAGFELSCRHQKPWDTTNLNGRLRKIDYLLVSGKQFTCTPMALPLLNADDPMPSSQHPADHLPLSVKFSLAQPEPRVSDANS